MELECQVGVVRLLRFDKLSSFCRSQAYDFIVAQVDKNVNSFLIDFMKKQRSVKKYRSKFLICAYDFFVKIVLTKAVWFDIIEI